MLSIVGFVVGVVSLALTYYGLRFAIRVHNETQVDAVEPGNDGGLPRITDWRRSSFPQALACCRQYVGELEAYSGANGKAAPDAPTHAHLGYWGIAALLSAAAGISRYSQGKANYWIVQSSNRDPGGLTDIVHLRSLAFVGIFPLWQLRAQNGDFRDVRVTFGDTHPETAIGQAVRYDRINFTSVLDDRISDKERRLGTTHVLAIPIAADADARSPGQAAGISVDFRIGRVAAWLLFRSNDSWATRRLLQRAEMVQRLARRLAMCPQSTASYAEAAD